MGIMTIFFIVMIFKHLTRFKTQKNSQNLIQIFKVLFYLKTKKELCLMSFVVEA